MKPIRYLVVILAALPILACGEASAEPESNIDASGGTIVMAGPINPEGVNTVESAFMSHPAAHILRVTSTGGDMLKGIELTDFLRSHHVSVVVRGYCVSACAQLLFAGTTSHAIEPGSVVLFHYTEAAFAEIRRARGISEPPDGAAVVSQLVAAYRRWNLDPELLTAPMALMEVRCFSVRQSTPPSVEYVSDYDAWMPSIPQLDKFRIQRPPGTWPESVQDLMPGLSALAKEHPTLAGKRVRAGGSAPPFSTLARSIPECKPSA